MTKLGDQMDDQMVDDMIAELDKEKAGVIEILDMAKATFQIKEEKKGDDKKEKKDAKKKWTSQTCLVFCYDSNANKYWEENSFSPEHFF